ncbi:CHAT domain-containing protein [Leptolyngbya iicbica]|uniref:CHAT domain-containing protein n=2 Tax=Cyanophyceae TaxID=3028117 RepID=A0A4V2E226_9CYAN|nr:CHAT domain-containing protein [Leptolyngbya sp. LK]RZM76576.1 CHAT domain-containing protein [Leptolyngbya sp. LK]
MRHLLRRLSLRPWLSLLFAGSLGLALLVGHPGYTHGHGLGIAALAQVPQSSALVEQGVSAYQAGNYRQAIALWQQAIQTDSKAPSADLAIVHENLARAYQQVGETQAAIANWEAAAAEYQASENTIQFGRMLTEQAQVYIGLGQQQRAAALLCGDEVDASISAEVTALSCAGGAYAIAEMTQDLTGQAAALGSLAETYRLRGNNETAASLLEIGLALVDGEADLAQYRAPMRNSLANLNARIARTKALRAEAAELLGLEDTLENDDRTVAERLRAESAIARQSALKLFDEAIDAAQVAADLNAELRSHLGLMSLGTRLGPDRNTLATSQSRVAQLISQLSASRETAYAAITLAKSYRQTPQNFACADHQASTDADAVTTDVDVVTWLRVGQQIAQQIGDDRAASFAFGELGHIAECQKDWAEATRLTNLAQLAANDALESADSLYLWEWQMGRILNQQGRLTDAATFYQKAIATLESIRADILTANQDLQFDFRDSVEPIYRQYLELQLASISPSTALKQTWATSLPVDPVIIDDALQTVDALRLAELQNFFGDNCVLVASVNARERLLTDDIPTTVITSVVLTDRTALIANLPDGTAKINWIDDTQKLEETADKFRDKLVRFTDKVYDGSDGASLYQQLIQPLEAELKRTQTETLVFVQDGFLRNIPMSALYDGNQYLIQQYAIATTPSLSLTASSSGNREYRMLAVGIDQEVVTDNGRRFDETGVRGVPQTIEAIVALLPGSRSLINEEFTTEQFAAALQAASYSILHVGSHGQFSTVPEETFIITGPNDSGLAEEITFNQLESLIRQFSLKNEPLELITLTACQTATGDDRATLGLAGVAIQSGARSAIASLWNLPGATSEALMPKFYSQLTDPTVSKAKALQTAQIEAIQNNPNGNPGRWAPLILVGNWQ